MLLRKLSLWFGLGLAATSRFLSVYAIRLDATPMLLGWMSALPAILALLTAAYHGERPLTAKRHAA